jgi:integrase/recombinase XerD
MRNRTRLYIPIDAWPAADRERWRTVLRKGHRLFDDAGAAAHLAPASRTSFEDAYARLLAFVTDRHDRLLGQPITEWFTLQVVVEYVAWQPASTGPRTLSNNLYWLGLMVRFMYPGHDWSFLFKVSNRLAARARRLPRQRPPITSDALYALGCELMDSAVVEDDDADDDTRRAASALQYRDGLIIALLASVPIRRRTITGLRLGRHVVRTGGTWSLDIPADLVKARRPLAYSISTELAQRIDVYVQRLRGRIKGAQAHDGMWPSESSAPMSYDRIYKTVVNRTKAAFGFPVRPHDFRTAAGTLWSIADPRNVRGVRDLLGHANFRTTEQFYIKAQSRVAGRTLAGAVKAAARKPMARV